METGNFDKRVLASEIDHLDAGKRIDNWLTSRFTYHSRNQWQILIKQGLLKLNGVPTKSSRKLKDGDRVAFTLTKDEPPVDFTYSIEFEDDYLYIINKCGNLPCHPAGPFYRNTLWHHLTSQVGDIYIVNRLDRETSGLMIIAKDKATAAKLSAMISDDSITKKYIAFVHGSVSEEMNASGYLVDDTKSIIRKKRTFISANTSQDLHNADYAETIIKPMRSSTVLSQVECILKTGRLHQIRATLYSLGYPMVGDKLYGLDDTMYLRLPADTLNSRDWAKLILSRQALHAYHLSFKHPVTAETVSIEIPLPTEMDFSAIKAQASLL